MTHRLLSPERFRLRRWIAAGVLMTLGLGFLAYALTHHNPARFASNSAYAAADGGQMVVLSASWCASCRAIVPIAQNVATNKGLNIQLIDVDSPEAPKQLKQAGLAMPTTDLPQIYYVQHGAPARSLPTILFDGRTYRYGQTEAVRSQLIQALEQAR